jgi:hypothetical protein
MPMPTDPEQRRTLWTEEQGSREGRRAVWTEERASATKERS